MPQPALFLGDAPISSGAGRDTGPTAGPLRLLFLPCAPHLARASGRDRPATVDRLCLLFLDAPHLAGLRAEIGLRRRNGDGGSSSRGCRRQGSDVVRLSLRREGNAGYQPNPRIADLTKIDM